jgi:hypothetical protein
MSYLPDSCKVRSGPGVSAQPPAKTKAGLIKKEIFLSTWRHFKDVVGAVFIRDEHGFVFQDVSQQVFLRKVCVSRDGATPQR